MPLRHRVRAAKLGAAALVVCGAVTAGGASLSASADTVPATTVPATTAPVSAGAGVPGAPAVLSAPSSLTGVSPQLPSGVLAASAAPGSGWQPEPATYGTASKDDIAVTGADGTTIRVNEIYPTTASGAPAKGPFPVVMTMTPYGKGQGGSSAPGSASSPSTSLPTGGADNYLVQRGYINVVMDVRGTGDSGGQWGLFDPIQTQDAIKVLDWAAKLPDSDGKVGTYGPSYLGINQLLLAGSVGKNSPLKAIFPDVAGNDIYRDTSFMGGLIDSEFSLTYLALTMGLNTASPLGDALTDPAVLSDLVQVTLDHGNDIASFDAALTANMLSGGDDDYDGAYWQDRAPQNLLASIVANGIPAYLVGGEFDLFQNGEPLNYAELQNAWAGRAQSGQPSTAPMTPGQATTGRYQLIDGPWEHINGSMVDLDPLELEWFDTWLKGEDTGMASTPTPLHYYDLGSGQFDETTTYPFTDAAPAKYYFGDDGSMSVSAPAGPLNSGTDTVLWSPSGVPCGRPLDQWSMGSLSIPASTAGLPAPCASADNLTQLGPWEKTYTTAPFSQAATLAGPMTATVYAKATTTETEWVAQVEMVTPSGQSYPLTEGALLGSLRAVDSSRSWTADGDTIFAYHPYTRASAASVTPGATTEYQIQVFPTLATIPKGDRLRVTISTTDAPHLVPTPAEVTELTGGIYQIQHTSSAPSSLTVELRPAS